MEVQGQILNGVIIPEDALSLPNGTHVTILIPSNPPLASENMSVEQRTRYLEALARIDGLPNENPDDIFGGADHDQALYGDRS